MAGSMAVLSLTACGGGTSTTATTAAAAAETTAAAADATTAAETSNSDAIVLQVAFENSISEPIGQGIVKAQELLKENPAERWKSRSIRIHSWAISLP